MADQTAPKVIDMVPINPGNGLVASFVPPTYTEARRPRQRAAPSGKRKGGRPKKNSVRGFLARAKSRLKGRKYGSRKKSPEVAIAARRSGGNNCTLAIGSTLLAVVVGATAAFVADLVVQRYASKSKPVRLAVAVGIGLLFWWVGGRAASAALSQTLRLVGATSALSGIVLVGVDTINQAAARS